MALELSARAELLSQKVNIQQQIAIQIDGIDLIFGSTPIFKFWRIGDDGVIVGQDGLVIGGVIEDENSRAYISLRGTTNNIQQQLEVTEGGSGSIQKFNVQLVDKDEEVTRVLTPGQVVNDVLGRDATVYISFAGGSFPEDYIRIFQGTVDQIESGPGFWRVEVAHPQQLTRVDLYEKIQTELTSAINASQTTIAVNNVNDFLLPDGENLRTCVRIDDEIIEYTGIAGTDLTGCIRGVEGTTATAHSSGGSADTFYILEGQPLDLALKTMLSRVDDSFAERDVSKFVRIDTGNTLSDAIIFTNDNLQEELGLVVGDLITTIGATNGANNVTSREITGFVPTTAGLAIVVGGAGLVEETDTSAMCSFKSQFDTLPVTLGGASAGCDMKPSQVDVAQHLRLQDLFSSQQPDLKIYIKDTISAKDLIIQELYRPSGYFQVPRKGRYSCNLSIPPLALEDLNEFNSDAVKNPDGIKQKRTVNKYFFNSVIYRFDEDPLEDDRFNAGEVVYSQRSVNRINSQTKSLTISSKGLRDTPATRNFIATQTRRFNDRYNFAAPTIKLGTKYKDGFDVEIADTVLFGDASLQLPNEKTADRVTEPQLYEVIDKSLNLKTGNVQFTLLASGFGLDGRYGVVSPNSFIDQNSTTTRIFLKNSFGTDEFGFERPKWENFIGEDILIRSQDWTFAETVTLREFDSGSLNGLVIDPALSVAPLEDYAVDLPYYPDSTDPSLRAKMKNIHCFFDPKVEVTAAVSDTVFEVGAGDIDKFFVGGFVQAHSADFADNSRPDTVTDDAVITVVDTVLNRITVDRTLTYTPQPGDFIELIGFADEGLPYRIV